LPNLRIKETTVTVMAVKVTVLGITSKHHLKCSTNTTSSKVRESILEVS
jgi:hypothetical protein